MKRRHANAVVTAAVVVAFAYLTTMVVVGELPKQRQLVKFEANGVMQTPPEQITQVELVQAARKVLLHRDPDAKRWATADGTTVPADAGEHLTMAVQMMNTSAPVKELLADELHAIDRTPFGLDRPTVEATLYRGEAPVIAMRFGNLNPEGYLQYMAVAGTSRVFLMSRFVGEEWRKAAEALRLKRG